MVNNTLVVTGGTRGIGKEIVKNFLKKILKFFIYINLNL